jgi:Flp pilus assembly protein TadD
VGDFYGVAGGAPRRPVLESKTAPVAPAPTRAVSFPHALQLAAGDRLEQYEILGPLGAGGMGEVYRARDTKLARVIALKILPPELASNAEALRRFEQEARAASALNHPNIVTIYDICVTAEGAWIAMELIDGADLRTLAFKEPLTIKNALRIAVKLADGLAAAHDRGIVHRDLKPDNVMVTADGFVKILDFGLAKQIRSITSDDTTIPHTSPGAVFGTLGYMSPEQTKGKEMDYRSDQFSFGVMLYEMLTRVRPFDRDSKAETMAAIIRDEVEPPSSIEEAVTYDLDRIVSRCLAKNPRDRYASTRDLARDLREIRDGLTQSSNRHMMRPLSGGKFRRLWKQWTRSKRGVRIAAGAVILALLAGGAYLWTHGRTLVSPRAQTAALGPAEQRQFIEALGLLKHVKDEHSVDRAIANLQSVLRNARDSGQVNALLARALLYKASLARRPALLEQAMVYATRGVALSPNDPDSHLTLGRLQNATRIYPDAVTSFQRALALRANDADAIVGLAEAYNGQGRGQDADKLYRKAVALRPDAPTMYSLYGAFCYAQGRYKEAAAHFRRATELSPEFAKDHSNLGAALQALGRHAEALAAYRKSLSIEPNPAGWSNLGTMQFYLGQYAEAQKSYEQAVALAPWDYLIWANLGDACRASGDKACADRAWSHTIGAARDAVAARPNDAVTRAILASSLAKNGQLDEAQREIRRALETNPTNTVVLYQASVVAALRGSSDSAISWLEQAVAGGYPAEDAARDPVFEPLRSLPAFRNAVKSRT